MCDLPKPLLDAVKVNEPQKNVPSVRQCTRANVAGMCVGKYYAATLSRCSLGGAARTDWIPAWNWAARLTGELLSLAYHNETQSLMKDMKPKPAVPNAAQRTQLQRLLSVDATIDDIAKKALEATRHAEEIEAAKRDADKAGKKSAVKAAT